MHPSQGTYSCDRSPSRGWRHFKTIACSANKSTSFATAASCSRRRSPVSPTTCMHYFECAERVTQSVALQGNESVHWYLVSDSMRVGGAAWWLHVATCCTQAGPACDVADANGNAEQPACCLIAFWTAVIRAEPSLAPRPLLTRLTSSCRRRAAAERCRCAGLRRSTTAASRGCNRLGVPAASSCEHQL